MAELQGERSDATDLLRFGARISSPVEKAHVVFMSPDMRLLDRHRGGSTRDRRRDVLSPDRRKGRCALEVSVTHFDDAIVKRPLGFCEERKEAFAHSELPRVLLERPTVRSDDSDGVGCDNARRLHEPARGDRRHHDRHGGKVKRTEHRPEEKPLRGYRRG